MNAAEAAMAGIFGSKGSGGGNVSGVKGDAEETYRSGNVNITAANVGAYTKTETDTLLNDKANKTDVDNVKISGTATNTSITLTDSADGYVQGVTVKGHSEVVDGAIKSIGDAGWGVVDLGTLTWQVAGDAPSSTYYVQSLPNGTTNDNNKTYLCAYVQYSGILANMPDKSIRGMGGQSGVYVRDTTYTDATAFKSAMSGVLLYYPLADTTGATPTLGITSKNGEGQGTAATITTGLPLRSTSDSIFDTLDNEKVVNKCAEVDLGDLTWELIGGTTHTFGAIVSGKKNATSGQIVDDIICSYYVTVKGDDIQTTDKSIAGSTNNSRIYVTDTLYSDATAFKTAVTGVKLVYPLATPTETPLTSAEISALASLKTYSTTHIDATDAPTMTVDYLLNTNNGKAVAKVDNKIVAIKSVSWTGTGTTSQTITFPEKPFMILGYTQTGDTVTPSRYTRGIVPFVYAPTTAILVLNWADAQTDSHAYDYQKLVHYRLTISNDGLSMSWTGADTSQALNDSGVTYTLYYI